MPKIKEVLVLHHSHLDIGYTHAQPILLELHKRYIDEALQLCELTEHWEERDRFRWTCESSYPVLLWLETANTEQVERMKRYLNNGQFSLSASFLHATPLCTAEEMTRMLQPITQLRSRFGIEMKTAIHHDVNGQPWPYGQLLLDAGIDFFIMGINIHFGGFPLARPGAFQWQVPDGRKLLAFNGEHYSLFSQVCDVNAMDTGVMAEGLAKYLAKIEANPDYPFDFVYLTATNLPLYDNNPPDRELAELIRKWNAEGREPSISFVTPELLRERVNAKKDLLQEHAGDWTDYWNFGSGSAAKETKLNRRTKQGMKAVDLLDSFERIDDVSYDRIKKQAWEQIMLYDEHTWGVFHSISEPNHTNTDIQWMHKAHYAYQANSLTGFLLGTQMERLAGNPLQSEEPEGLLLANPSSVPIEYDIQIPSSFRVTGRHLAADRMRHVLMNNERNPLHTSYGIVELPPFSWRKIPFRDLKPAEPSDLIEAFPGQTEINGEGPWEREVVVEEGRIETPFHRLRFNPITGRITSLFDKNNDWESLDLSSPWSLFQYVQETVDPTFHPNDRNAIFPRDVAKGNEGISVWNHDWKARRQTYSRLISCRVERGANCASLFLKWEAPGVEELEQRITLFGDRGDIELKASFLKEDITTPEGTYFAFPLNLKKWRCHYDTAGQFAEMDAQQLPGVCRDYLTVDKSVSVADEEHGVTLVCVDAPLVQVGDFHFGKEQKQVERRDNPLLLAWPMNNYWDTNFRARQPGFNTFTYVLSTFREFDPAATMAKSMQAVTPVISIPAVVCSQEEAGRFIELVGDEGIRIFDVKPSEKGSGIVIRLGNCTDGETQARIGFPGRMIEAACQTDALEQFRTGIEEMDGQCLIVKLGPKQMAHLLVVLA
ncbi:glycosyl hydrolase-related protein [Cohnella sp. WQ 127256]|uniref:glycoside hydrolase family 38 N-terminal domain-containing protein n=1 Tax=Cohnella sp. WQ 127256 TaxID=2938790 RepID=UPI002117E873|nr:glycosyl hydrolase-related protein [Cohnella sp. WQ 127256]